MILLYAGHGGRDGGRDGGAGARGPRVCSHGGAAWRAAWSRMAAQEGRDGKCVGSRWRDRAPRATGQVLIIVCGGAQVRESAA
jgi:hypothetical protein